MNLTLQFVAAFMLFYGLAISGNMRWRGPAIAALAEVIFFGCAVPYGMWGIVFLSAVLFVIQARNAAKWWHEGLPW